MRCVGLLAFGLLVVGCKPAPGPSAPASPAPSAPAAQRSIADVPADVRERLPALVGRLPKVPGGALRITLDGEGVDVGRTSVATLDDGWLSGQGQLDLARAMTVAGSPSRPVALFVDADARAGAVVDLVNAAAASGGSVVGLVARDGDESLGWIPIRASALGAPGESMIRLEDAKDWAAVAEEAWSHAGGLHQLTVGVDDFMRAQVLFEALHQLRGPRCADEPGACRFALLGLASRDTRPPGPGALAMRAVRFDTDGRPIDGAAELRGALEGSAGFIEIGRGSGSGLGLDANAGSGAGSRVPRIRQAKPTVTTGLDRDVIRRIVRAHINEVRHCYNQGLVKDPDLEGRVTVEFTIAASGTVAKVKLGQTTVSDGGVGLCITKAVARWKFPKPRGGGKVKVTYPFVLSPG